MRFIYFIYITLIHALIPSHLPNGKIKKYIHHKDINKEIVVVDHKSLFLISRNWLSNILNYNSVKNIDLNNCPDIHIITKINELETLFQDEQEYVYMTWMPKCIYGSVDVLYIIVSEKINNFYKIKLVIQSPFWSSEQIESFELKNALNNYTNNTIDFTEFYESDLRYRLAWSTWNLKQDLINHSIELE